MTCRVRLAQEDDISRIRKWEESAFGFTWDRETFLRELTRPNGGLLVFEKEQKPVGAALLAWAADEIQLNSMVLDSAERGQGLSRVYLGQMMLWAREQKFSWMTLEVKWNNEPAHRLYRRLGFVTTASRPRYYRDGQDARIMWAGHLESTHFGAILEKYSSEDLCLGLRRERRAS